MASTSPGNGATGVPVNAAPAVAFDQAITGSHLGGITIEEAAATRWRPAASSAAIPS